MLKPRQPSPIEGSIIGAMNRAGLEAPGQPNDWTPLSRLAGFGGGVLERYVGSEYFFKILVFMGEIEGYPVWVMNGGML